MSKKEVVLIGAGKIGRGYLAELFDVAGYHLTFLNIRMSSQKQCATRENTSSSSAMRMARIAAPPLRAMMRSAPKRNMKMRGCAVQYQLCHRACIPRGLRIHRAFNCGRHQKKSGAKTKSRWISISASTS